MKKILCIIFLVILIMTKGTETHDTVTVRECSPTHGYYEVVVEDAKGNLWAYYDSDPQPLGKALKESYARGENK